MNFDELLVSYKLGREEFFTLIIKQLVYYSESKILSPIMGKTRSLTIGLAASSMYIQLSHSLAGYLLSEVWRASMVLW